MGKKQLETMEKLKAKFLAGCLANPEFRIGKWKDEAEATKLVDKIWEDWRNFASYAFNKSHAVCYAVLAYQTGWLKAHYPAQFMCAEISSLFGKFDQLPGLVVEADEMGLRVVPPSVNESIVRFSTDGKDGIRYGLGGIKGVGEIAAQLIVDERKANGEYKDYQDFVARVAGKVNKKAIEALARCGALDCFGLHRARLVHALDTLVERTESDRRDREAGQGSLFDLLGDAGLSAKQTGADDIPDCEPWSRSEELEGEHELLGMYVSGHPIDEYRPLINAYATLPISKIPQMLENTPYQVARFAGLATEVANRFTKQDNKPWAVISLSDAESRVDVLAFPKTYEKFSSVIVAGQPLLVCGEASKRDGQLRIIPDEIYPLLDAPKHFTSSVQVIAGSADKASANLDRIMEIAKAHPGNVPLRVGVTIDDGRTVIVEAGPRFNVEPSLALLHEFEKVAGRKNCRLIPIDKLSLHSHNHWHPDA